MRNYKTIKWIKQSCWLDWVYHEDKSKILSDLWFEHTTFLWLTKVIKWRTPKNAWYMNYAPTIKIIIDWVKWWYIRYADSGMNEINPRDINARLFPELTKIIKILKDSKIIVSKSTYSWDLPE